MRSKSSKLEIVSRIRPSRPALPLLLTPSLLPIASGQSYKHPLETFKMKMKLAILLVSVLALLQTAVFAGSLPPHACPGK